MHVGFVTFVGLSMNLPLQSEWPTSTICQLPAMWDLLVENYDWTDVAHLLYLNVNLCLIWYEVYWYTRAPWETVLVLEGRSVFTNLWAQHAHKGEGFGRALLDGPKCELRFGRGAAQLSDWFMHIDVVGSFSFNNAGDRRKSLMIQG